ncbi:MAG: hypothetical protein J7L23_05525 [Candidatus Diapherotrites archaeon]|nr:hypothetical protein [Candidatus Diapherotrites archaeon]
MKKENFLVVCLLALAVISLSGCLENQETGNKLEELAKIAPSDSNAIMYIDANKLLKNEYILKTEHVPPAVGKVAPLVSDGGIVYFKGNTVISIKGIGFDTMAELAPKLQGLLKLAGIDLKIKERKVNSETIYDVEDKLSYWVYDKRIFLGERKGIEEFINARKSGQTATQRFKEVMVKVEDNDVMAAVEVNQTPVKNIGISASLDGEVSEVSLFIETESPNSAKLVAALLPAGLPEWVKVKGISTNGEWIYCKLEVSIDRLNELSRVSFMPKVNAETPKDNNENVPKLGITPPCTNTEECLNYCGEHPDECNKVIANMGLPCKTMNECQIYCFKNPAECEKLMENLSDYLGN